MTGVQTCALPIYITPYIGSDPPGAILTIRMLTGGLGYVYVPQIDLTGYGDGTATAHAEIDDVYRTLEGRWLTSDSIISSSERKLQGRNYFVDYSYVTSSLTDFKKYKNILKQLMHPAGFVNYADLNKQFDSNVVISTIETTTNTISGTINVANGSIYVTGMNTKFNVANTRGTLTIGSNIAVNGVIRTVSSIISNTNLSVTSAFTYTANNQDMVVVNTAYNAISTEGSLEFSTEDGLVITVES